MLSEAATVSGSALRKMGRHAESEAVLPMLCAHVAAPEHCVRVSYEQGDICLFVSTRPSQPAANSPA